MFSPITIYQTRTWTADKKLNAFRALNVRQIKNQVLYDLGEYFCVNNTDQKDRQPPLQTGAVWQEEQMLPIVQDRSKPTPIVRDRPKLTIQRSKTVFYTSKINFNA
jgi:hypothetical protein